MATLFLAIVAPCGAALGADLVPPLRTDGLSFADDLKAIHAGDFAGVRFARDSADATALVGAHIDSFSERCESALPKNRVELTKEVCQREA